MSQLFKRRACTATSSKAINSLTRAREFVAGATGVPFSIFSRTMSVADAVGRSVVGGQAVRIQQQARHDAGRLVHEAEHITAVRVGVRRLAKIAICAERCKDVDGVREATHYTAIRFRPRYGIRNTVKHRPRNSKDTVSLLKLKLILKFI